MQSKLNNIASCLLILVFTASSVGINVYHHMCSKTRTAYYSLSSKTSCEQQTQKTCNCSKKIHSCCHKESQEVVYHSKDCNYSACCVDDIKTIALEGTYIAPEKNRIPLLSILDIVPRKELIDLTDSYAIKPKFGKTLICDTSPGVFIISYIHTSSFPEDPANGIS